MTASRSFAPRADVEDGDTSPPVFPLLPYAYMAYAEHCSHDYAHYVDTLAHVDERPLPSQQALGLEMLNDMNRAFFALVWAPLGTAIGRTRI